MQTNPNAMETYDRNLLLSAFQRANSITEVAKIMGTARSTIRKKAKKLGLQKECSELGKKNRKTSSNIESLQKPTNKKEPKPIQRFQSKCLDRESLSSTLEETLALKGEMRKAQQEEQHEKVNLSEKQSNDFFEELKTRLDHIVESRNDKVSEDSKVEEKPATSLSRKGIAEVLLTIVPILVSEYNKAEN